MNKELKKQSILDKINAVIKEHMNNKISGKIIINFFEGGITSWKIEKTYKP